ncbi:MAG: hypothetical protein HRT45_00560 [Bdellovibrionales bacterium]|nr:hypothetical protein [Bdellovibrionales bacterium]
MNDFTKTADIIKNMSFNALDVFLLVAFALLLTTGLNAFGVPGSVFGVAIFIVILLPAYTTSVRPALVANPLLSKLLPRDLPEEHKSKFSPLNLVSATLIYVGAIAIFLTFSISFKPTKAPQEITDLQARTEAKEQIERQNLFDQMNLIANAKPVSAHEIGDSQQTSIEQIERDIAAENQKSLESRTQQIKDETMKQRWADYEVRKADNQKRAVFHLLISFGLFFLGAASDKLTNVYHHSKINKAAN